jgi:DNA replication and repair protein RecF
MRLCQLDMINFKSHAERHWTFNSQVTAFTGLNGIGKTNILDAIYYLCMSKSNFGQSDLQLIQFDKPFFTLQAQWQLGDEKLKIRCAMPLEGKKIWTENTKPIERMTDLVGRFPVVMITPYDVSLILEGGEVRRKFVDAALCQLNQEYLLSLIQYNKLLQQRNALLKQSQNFSQAALNQLLDTYDAQLAPKGQFIYEQRVSFLQALLAPTQEFYTHISQGRETINIQYETQLEKANLAQLIAENRNADIYAQRTLQGIHRDDWVFELNGQPIKKFGSQGQQKSFLLALKFAQWQISHKHKGFKPLLLLDDLYDRMDQTRIDRVAELFPQFGQVILTDTHAARIKTGEVIALSQEQP